ncbi:hypothetical protein LINGRAHAP2_LOCUS10308, partial [Linum grandiflorum]
QTLGYKSFFWEKFPSPLLNFPPYHPSSPLILFSILLQTPHPPSPIINGGGDHHLRRSPLLSRSAAVAAVATSRRRRPSLSLSFAPAKEAAASPALSPLCSATAATTKEAAASLVSLAQVTVDEDGQHSPEFVSDEVG